MTATLSRPDTVTGPEGNRALVDHAEHPIGNAGFTTKLNWLRAAVLGANDGIVSIAGLVVGVAGASTDRMHLVIAGVAGLVAGALSMAAGEYVSVSTQRDSEKAIIARKKSALSSHPERELETLTRLYQAKGLDRDLAVQVAKELSANDALAAHAETALGVDPDELTNPWHAAWASMLAFSLGALLPLLAILLPGPSWRVPITFGSVLVALALTGGTSAKLGEAPIRPAVIRNVLGGALAMAITYVVGILFGTFG
ncbi:VIT1/CCC1 transporter family protein [Aestuariimicrobium ganziense]|uniref:VIT1/CCC1 transporter family protein n=1 Tax=Aestuariimicrobium ganziense TaxID=2773677 RepID=UPI001943F150|nr:VIT family protein [Aestuariimicrobium ganziense]